MTRAALAAAAALALVSAGCGGDDEQKASTAGGQRTAARSHTTTAEGTATVTPTVTTKKEPADQRGPEQQPGGAGDEVAARSQALLTGKGGRITPHVVRVPPFISVRVELRSADGRRYGLRIGGKRLAAGGALSSDAATLDGLRAGSDYVGVGSDGSRIQIVANAEPGP